MSSPRPGNEDEVPSPQPPNLPSPGAPRLVAFLPGPAAALVVALAPLPLAPAAHSLAAILSWVVLYWIMEPVPLPVTALVGAALCVLAGLGTAKSVFASFAHPIIFLFIGSFLLAQAMAVHGVDRRFAVWMLSLPVVGDRPARILLALGTVTAIVSMWISNTAATALMLPIALGVIATLEASQASPLEEYRVGLLLMLSYAATAGGVATMIGTPPNLIGVGLLAEQTGRTVSFLAWMAYGVPLAAIMLITCWRLLLWLTPPGAPRLPALARHLAEQRRQLGQWSRGERNATLAFSVALLLWIGPGLLTGVLGPEHHAVGWIERHLPTELVALLAAALLFVLPLEPGTGRFTLSWTEATGINWGTILLFGGGLAFGDLMVKTGLSETLGQGLVGLLGVEGVWGLTAVAIGVALLLSELASNTASASMLVPVVIAIAQSVGVSPIPPALGVCLGASLGFALPVSTPPNAIVYGTGLVPIRRMVRCGVLVDVIGAAMIFVILRLLCPLLGLS